jgi:hypothetical protein
VFVQGKYSSARFRGTGTPRVNRFEGFEPLTRILFQNETVANMSGPTARGGTCSPSDRHNSTKKSATHLVQDLLVGLWQCHFLLEYISLLL